MKHARVSCCKVNLILNILGRREDGFHEVETVMHPVPVCDELTFETTSNGVELICRDPALPTDGSNLVHRAAAAFLVAAHLREGVRVHLDKRVPLAAGLGGGSADAANTLLGLNELFGQPLPADRLHNLATRLGSDVPFFLQSRPALATGRGEQIEPLDWFPAFRSTWLLLIHPGFGVATGWAYQNLMRFPTALNGQPGRATRLVERLQANDLRGGLAEMYNSLEAPVFEKYPILRLFQEFLRQEGALATLMCGSGSTTLALAADEPTARTLRERFRAKFGRNCWTTVVPMTPA